MKPALIALCALLLLPGTALAAPTLEPLKACYVSVAIDESTGNTISETVEIAGSGFTPNAEVGLFIDGNTAGRAIADAAGAIRATVQAPYQERGEREFTLTALDPTHGALNVITRVTALTVTVTPRKANPRRKVTITGRGFTAPDLPVYAHYTRRGRDRKTVRLAKPTGPCGTFRTRRRQFPMRRPAKGLWLLRIDQDRRFARSPKSAYVDLDVFVKRVIRRRR